ncbi:MAG: hypothetical protein QOD86_238 [Miltoncostaeaceae bacterium]|jgi:hypothetical protein|nr:hypothetical protein [Miltoncostaeaceae bacterium]
MGEPWRVDLPDLWRRAGTPAAAHDLAETLLGQARYHRTRGVAQQAARLARARRLDRGARARLLAAAWLHDLGGALAPGPPALAIARALRRAGQEPLARIVAHCANAPLEAALEDRPPVARELPPPAGVDAVLLLLLDVALVTTAENGARAAPTAALRDLARRRDPRPYEVRARVALIARLADDPGARELIERVAAPGA